MRSARGRLGRLPLPSISAHRQCRRRPIPHARSVRIIRASPRLRDGDRPKPEPVACAARDRPRARLGGRRRRAAVELRLRRTARRRERGGAATNAVELAVSADGERWLLLNCSPDIAAQIESFAPLQPRDDARHADRAACSSPTRTSTTSAASRCCAKIGEHAIHRPLERGGARRSPPRSRRSPLCAAAASLARRAARRALRARKTDDIVGNQLAVRAFSVPGTTPGYDGRRPRRGAVVAYEVSDLEPARTACSSRRSSARSTPRFCRDRRGERRVPGRHVLHADELISQRLMEKRAECSGISP